MNTHRALIAAAALLLAAGGLSGCDRKSRPASADGGQTAASDKNGKDRDDRAEQRGERRAARMATRAARRAAR